MNAEWQKLRENAKGLRRKVWTGTNFLKPNIRYFVPILRLVAIYSFYKAFGNTRKNNELANTHSPKELKAFLRLPKAS